MNLNKKNLTKLLNADYRRRILTWLTDRKDQQFKISRYAKLLVDEQLAARNVSLKADKESFYGFSPLIAICSIQKDGEMFSFMLEANVLNHFLVADDKKSAIEAATCILILFVQSNHNVRDFDLAEIEAQMTKLHTNPLKIDHAF